MKTLIVVVGAVAAAVLALFLLRDYMPGALLGVGALIVVLAALAGLIQRDPHEGWRRVRVLAIVAALPLTLWTLIGAGGQVRYGVLIPVALVLDIALMFYCTSKMAKARQHRPTSTAVASPSASSFRSTRSYAEKVRINEELMRGDRERERLAAENEALRQKVERQRREASMPADPFADEPAQRPHS